MMSSHHGLYVQGYTRATMVGTKRRKLAREAGLQGVHGNWGEVVTR